MPDLKTPVSSENGWVCSDIKVPGKMVIITGANTGMGFWTAVDLARREAKVIIACRSDEKAQDAKIKIINEAKCSEENVIAKVLDLASFASIRKFAEDINTNEERLDVLINNAGVWVCPESKTEDEFETHFGVNYLGPFLLTHLLLDLLRKSAPSRILLLASNAYKYGSIKFNDLNATRGYDASTAYNQSKLAIVFYNNSLAKELEGSGVTVNNVDPGFVKTDMQRYINEPGSFITKTFVKVHQWLVTWKTAQHGAQCSVYCAVAPELENISGRYFKDCQVESLSNIAKDEVIAKKLWDISMKLTKLKE
uniref:Retinol dehydrogenase 14-like n=1 Tax=Phallusia mammillata TaxID=59560 RepID=A0A6F9DR84_9ASCI|nr:retinol dehydrogenase 14-like [Phallusia mammillata]